MKKYVAYYRVSTEDQGKSGLGIASQKDYVHNFITSNGYLLMEFQDIETGKNDSREGIQRAMLYCKKHQATLVAYDISRISRGGYTMMAELENNGIDFIEAVSPYDSNFSKGIKFIVGKEEADRISRNTKKALGVIQDKLEKEGSYMTKAGRVITKLGSPVPISRNAVEASAKLRTKRAISNPDNIKAGAFIIALKKGGNSFYSIAKLLKASGFKTSRDNDFSQVQVKRLYNRYKKEVV